MNCSRRALDRKQQGLRLMLMYPKINADHKRPVIISLSEGRNEAGDVSVSVSAILSISTKKYVK